MKRNGQWRGREKSIMKNEKKVKCRRGGQGRIRNAEEEKKKEKGVKWVIGRTHKKNQKKISREITRKK